MSRKASLLGVGGEGSSEPEACHLPRGITMVFTSQCGKDCFLEV